MSREATKVAPNDECETRLSSQSRISEIFKNPFSCFLLLASVVSSFEAKQVTPNNECEIWESFQSRIYEKKKLVLTFVSSLVSIFKATKLQMMNIKHLKCA